MMIDHFMHNDIYVCGSLPLDPEGRNIGRYFKS